ncbi:MAG: T9SS type A sorting domain-containing protein, partial [Bacteroidota bacterium]
NFSIKCDELCDPCIDPELDVIVISNANESSSCTFVVVNNNHTECSNWIVNGAAIVGNMGSIEFISSDVQGDLNICVTNCHPECTEEEVCITIPQQQIEKCNFGNIKNFSAEIKLFPNPARESIVVLSEKHKLKRIVIYDDKSNMIRDQKFDGTSKSNLDISELKAGIYNLKAWTIDGKVAFETFIKI